MAAENHRQQTEENARKLGSLESDVTGLKSDMGQLRADMREGFAEIFRKIDRASTPRATPWGAVAVLVTVLLALAAWGNAWVSQAINGARLSSDEALRRSETNAEELARMMRTVMEREIESAEKRGRSEERLRHLESGFDKPDAIRSFAQ